MNGQGRIRDTGTEEDRALLRAGDPVVPPDLQERVRRATEARIAAGSRPRRVRIVWALAGTLIAGSAVAAGVREVRMWFVSSVPTPPADVAPAASLPDPAADPTPQPIPQTPPAGVPPVPRPLPPVSRGHATSPPPPLPPPALQSPALSHDDFARAIAQPPQSAPAQGTPRPTDALVILREGRRDVRLHVTGDRVTGDVRGTPVSLRIGGSEILGRIGGEAVNLWMVGRKGTGSMAGWDAGFVIIPTNAGDLLRGTIPGHTVRVEHGPGVLSWYPGCGRDLPAVGPGVYEGMCDGDRRARVVIPEALARMPALPRLILLSVLLTEKDPVFEYDTPRLFPPER